jgi:hypothetical protein
MLLRPLRFSHEADEQVGFLLHIVSTNKMIDGQLCTSTAFYRHALSRKGGENRGRVCVYLHREREPPVEVLEPREVRLATDFQQGIGFRHFSLGPEQ